MSEIEPPFELPAIRISQPLGAFYITRLTAELLLKVSFSDPLRLTDQDQMEHPYLLRGAQRQERETRLVEIGRYIDTVEAAFPNSIILAVNQDEDGELIDELDHRRWRLESNNGSDCVRLIVPTSAKVASIVDGQHRLHGFKYASNSRLATELLCAVYFDLPNPYQAYLFATINFNQKKVDRSLAYELFGFDLESEPPNSWSPEKTAVFMCRQLNTETESPLYQHITVAPLYEAGVFETPGNGDWKVSTATVVDGSLRLFSANPRRDRDQMHRKTVESGRDRSMLEDDGTPLRKLYLATNDKALYTAVRNYFVAVHSTLWKQATPQSYIRKTAGLQGLFDVLVVLLRDFETSKNISVEFFKRYLANAAHIDFSDDFFQTSGKGKTRIKNAIELAMGVKTIDEVPQGDRDDYLKVTKRK
jgi:DNA phosphorothioation-associated DGQHR protein 1